MTARPRLSLSLIALILGLLFCSCETKVPKLRDSSARARPKPTVSWSESQPPGSVDFRELWPDPIPEAVNILRELGSGASSAAKRLELAEIYRAKGFYAASRFFENTVHVARAQPLDRSPVMSLIAWKAYDADVTGESLKDATAIARLDQKGQYTLAAELAKKDLETKPRSLQAVSQWAGATVWKITAVPEKVSPEAREAALRILLTTLEERVPPPVGLELKPGAYATLSDAFLRLGDRVSSLTAAVEGVKGLGANGEFGDVSDPDSLNRLCPRIMKLEADLGLSRHLWVPPGDPCSKRQP